MNKTVKLTNAAEAQQYLNMLCVSAAQSQENLRKVMNDENPLNFLYEIKFNPIGCDPLLASEPLNLIEQVNQTFTYMASFRAAILLFEWHKEKLQKLTLNLGTKGGTDIESTDCDGIAAEVFAAVKLDNNRKLCKDIEKVSKTKATHKYVFFMCPKKKKGFFPEKKGIKIYSIGADL